MAAKTSNVEFKVEKFEGRNNFSLWQIKVKDMLVQYSLHNVLKGKSKKSSISDEDWEEMDLRAVSNIQLCLANEVTFNVANEKFAAAMWLKFAADMWFITLYS